MPSQLPPELCPICKEKEQFQFKEDYSENKIFFSLYECLKCDVQFWVPFKNPGPEWYKFRKKDKKEKPILYRGYHKKFLKLYSAFLPGAKVLDIGCGRGELLNELQKLGCDCWGVDFDESVIKVAKNYFGLKNVFVADLNSFFDVNVAEFPKFDIITFFEVLEHLDNPLYFIEGVIRMLKPNGKLVMSVPSRERLFADNYYWDFPPSHLSRWNKEAVSNFFKKIGFKIMAVYYTDQFFHLRELFFQKTQLGLMKKMKIKTDDLLSNLENKKESHGNIIHTRSKSKSFIVKFLIKFKKIILSDMPVVFILLYSKLVGIKNGVMVIELKRDEISN